MQFTIFTAKSTGKASNRDYPNKVEVTSAEVLQEAVKKIMSVLLIRKTREATTISSV